MRWLVLTVHEHRDKFAKAKEINVLEAFVGVCCLVSYHLNDKDGSPLNA